MDRLDNPRRRLRAGDLLVAYGAALAVPSLIFVFIPGDVGWALAVVALGLVCLAAGYVVKRRQVRRDASADSTAPARGGHPGT